MLTKLLDLIKRYWTYVVGLLGIIGHLIILISYFSSFFKWGNTVLLVFIRDNYLIIWIVSLTIILFAIIFWILKITRRFLWGFSDSFRKRLNQKWDFVGPWSITEENYLIVTGSDEGGITKNGSDWENYFMFFKAKIVTNCIGVIVRAIDLQNYYMFQFGRKEIVPHKRISFPRVRKNISDPNINEVEMQTGWQIFKGLTVQLTSELNDWFEGKIVVKGQSVSIYINNQLVFHQNSFLEIPKGKVGFRCHSIETGYIKQVKVRLII